MEDAIYQALVLVHHELEASMGTAAWLVPIPAPLGIPKGSCVSCIEGSFQAAEGPHWLGKKGPLTCVQGVECQLS